MSVLIKIGGNLYDSSLYVLPEERIFRDAWSADSEAGVISVDMPMARNIWRERIRRARAPRLLELDADFMKALETGASTTAIVAEKQALRDVTNIVTEAEITGTTVDEVTTELKAIWDEELLGPKPE